MKLLHLGLRIYEQRLEFVNTYPANTAYWHVKPVARYTPRMRFPTSPPRPPRAAAAVLTILLWIGFSAAAGAATPEGLPPEAQRASAVEEWKGRFCTATSCRNTPASPLSAAASFGAAVLAIRWLARRPDSRRTAPASSE